MTKTVNRVFLCALIVLFCMIGPADVQARDMHPYPRVRLQSLDKGTARTMTFEADVGSTIRFGPLYIRVQSCRKSAPIDEPESAAFLEIWETGKDQKPEWVFSGWMFASSPGLSAMDHPIYDVWVLDCLGADGDAVGEGESGKVASPDNQDEESTNSQEPDDGDPDEVSLPTSENE